MAIFHSDPMLDGYDIRKSYLMDEIIKGTMLKIQIVYFCEEIQRERHISCESNSSIESFFEEMCESSKRKI
jgi:hypothetical protein